MLLFASATAAAFTAATAFTSATAFTATAEAAFR